MDEKLNGIISLSRDALSLTISGSNALTVAVAGYLTISGTYAYLGDGSAGTFRFALDYSSLNPTISGTAESIGSAFAASSTDGTGAAPEVTYTAGSLSVVLPAASGASAAEGGFADSGPTVIFIK